MDVRSEARGGGDERRREGLARSRPGIRCLPHPETDERLPRGQLREERRARRLVPGDARRLVLLRGLLLLDFRLPRRLRRRRDRRVRGRVERSPQSVRLRPQVRRRTMPCTLVSDACGSAPLRTAAPAETSQRRGCTRPCPVGLPCQTSTNFQPWQAALLTALIKLF